MRLITTTEKTAEIFGDEESVRILAEAGFDAIDWGFLRWRPERGSGVRMPGKNMRCI